MAPIYVFNKINSKILAFITFRIIKIQVKMTGFTFTIFSISNSRTFSSSQKMDLLVVTIHIFIIFT